MRQLGFYFIDLIFILAIGSAQAQDLDLTPDQPVEAEVETLYDRLDEQSENQYQTSTQEEKQSSVDKSVKVESLSDLARLQAFEDIAVIQKRFLPKTHRFEISGLGFTNINNPFFNNSGLGVKGAYHFTEKWALEGVGNWFGVAARQVSNDLRDKAGITVDNVVTVRSYLGAAVKWSPIYGKISLLNKSIVPFDLSFSLGGGVTKTDQADGEPTLHIGTSQNFAISKSWSFRWDMMWNFYEATAVNNGVKGKIAQNDLFIGLGVSLFIPGATYR